MKKKFFFFFSLMLVFGGMSASAKAVDFDINTSCGASHHVSEVGDNLTPKQFEEFVMYIDWVYCG